MNEWLSELVAGMPVTLRLIWGAIALVLGVVVIVTLRVERSMFAARGRKSAWWQMRLAALPILGIAAALVWLPTRAVAGPEGLAVFYGALFTLAPAAWFGLHLLVGRLTAPRLSKGESVWLASSALAVLLCPPLVLSALQGPVFMLGRTLERQARNALDERAPPVAAGPLLRWDLGAGDALFGRALRIPAGVMLERIEVGLAVPGQADVLWSDTATQVHPWMCRSEGELHLAWPAGTAAPVLRAFWRDAQGGHWRGALPQADGGDEVAIPAPAVLREADAVVLPLALSRDSVQRGRLYDARRVWMPLPAARTLEELGACAQRIALEDEGMDAVRLLIPRGDRPLERVIDRGGGMRGVADANP